MKTRNYLLPYTYKKVGMWMFLPFAALCLCLFLSSFFNLNFPEIKVPWIAVGDKIFYKGEANLVSTLGMLGFLVSLCFIALSREKDEDEMTGQIRMQSFVWSWWVTAIILALGILFIMGLDFLVFTCAAIFLYFLVYTMKFNLTMKAIRREGK